MCYIRGNLDISSYHAVLDIVISVYFYLAKHFFFSF